MKDHLKHFIPFIPLVLLAAGLYYAKIYMPDSLCLLQNQQVITITDDGFTPDEVSISKCTRITFENTDEAAHWPASDPHSQHTAYPEFDPKKAIAPKSSWSFTFTKPGEWMYHDDLNPDLNGKIIVK